MQDLVPALIVPPFVFAPGLGWIDPIDAIDPGPAGEVLLFALLASARGAPGRRAEVPGLSAETSGQLAGRRVR